MQLTDIIKPGAPAGLHAPVSHPFTLPPIHPDHASVPVYNILDFLGVMNMRGEIDSTSFHVSVAKGGHNVGLL